MTNKIGFIGAGNMASSLIRGLLNSGVAPGQIVAADPVAEADHGAGVFFSEDLGIEPGFFPGDFQAAAVAWLLWPPHGYQE